MDVSSDSVASLFGSSLRHIREKRGWSQSELARQMQQAGWEKYSQVSVSRTEDGSRMVRLDEALAIANVLRCQVGDLLQSDQTSRDLQEGIARHTSATAAAIDAFKASTREQSLLRHLVERAEDRYNSGEVQDSEKSELHYWIDLAKKRLKIGASAGTD